MVVYAAAREAASSKAFARYLESIGEDSGTGAMDWDRPSRRMGALCADLDIPYVDLSRFELDPELVARLPETHARRYRALVLKATPTGLLVGMGLGILLGWGLLELFPGTLDRGYRLLYAANRVAAFAGVDAGAFDGQPFRTYNVSPDALLVNPEYTVRADTIQRDRLTGRGEAFGNVQIMEPGALNLVTGDHALFLQAAETAEAQAQHRKAMRTQQADLDPDI